MPNYDVHKKIGFIFSFIISTILILFVIKGLPLQGREWIYLPLVILFYSNLPDLDHHMGKLRKKTLTIIFTSMVLIVGMVYFFDISLLMILFMIIGFLGLFIIKVPHRGPLHTYWFCTMASIPLITLNLYLFIIGLGCSFMHVFVDRLISKTKRKVKKGLGITNQVNHHHFWKLNFKF